jgi:carboxypeptidase family protein/TonB-dependent receptor-like protein
VSGGVVSARHAKVFLETKRVLTRTLEVEVKKARVFFSLVWLLSFLFCGALSAQVANNTSLVGTVIESSGSAVAGAKVTAVNVGTNDAYTGTTNEEGYYALTFIREGTYQITIEKAGFAKSVQKGILVQANQAVRTDVTLQVGAVTETVVVDVAVPAISTDDATLAETISARSVTDLPLNGRDALKLATTTSNVIQGPKSDFTGIPPGEDFIGAGQREITNSLSLDGITIMNNLITVTTVTPNVDAVQEVQIQNGNYTAQYGSYMGVHVNLVTKSGTNNLHGSLFEFLRNDVFDAHPYFDPPGTPKQPLRFNQFGTAIDGPVYLPKIYDGRNRTFFTASYEGLRQIRSNSVSGTAITEAERKGDFSALLPSTIITDPLTGLPFAGNIIPTGRLSAQSLALLTYLPLPQSGSTIFGNSPSNIVTNQTLERIDQNIGDKVRLFFRYDWQNMTFTGGNLDPNPTNVTSGPANNRNFAFGYTHSFTPSLINDFRFGRNHLVTNALNYFYIHGLTSAGTDLNIPGFTGDTVFGNPGIPDINIDNYNSTGNAGTNWFQDDTTWHGYDQISYTRGKHTMMAGVEFRKLTTGRAAANSPRGVFNFTGEISGDPAADFLLGYPASDTTPLQEVKGVVAEWRDGFFVLDNWQVTRKLTLNYGLRYELPTVPYSVNGFARILNADGTALTPDTIPSPGFQFIKPNHDNWAPRLGFAYRLTNKTVVRGGGGIFYNPNQTNSFTLSTTNPPFGATSTYSALAPYNSPTGCLLSFGDPTPASCLKGASPVVNVFRENPYLPTPRLYQWNLGAERELWKNAGFELQYLGSRSIHLDRSYYDNQPTPGPGSIQSRRPNQLWGQIRTIQNDEIASYNGLTAIFRQRMNRGLQVLASYTWSHDLDISSDSNDGGYPVNAYNWRADYGNSNWDIRHRFVSSVIYELPALKGSNWLVKSVLGGWQLNNITTLQSGKPVNVTLAADIASISRAGNQRPDIVGPLHADCNSSHINSCIDISAFAQPAAFSLGTGGRNKLVGPAYLNTDFSLFKSFPIHESLKLQFRAEFFNAFNRPQLGTPDGTITSFDPANPGSFGNITYTVADNRDIQFGLKLVF